MKTDKTFDKIHDRTFSKIHVKISDKNRLHDEITADQKNISSSRNLSITRKMIFVSTAAIQIMHLITINIHLISTDYSSRMTRLNHNLLEYSWESIQEHRLYMLVASAIMRIVITIFTSLMNLILTLKNHTNNQKTRKTFSQKSETEIYFSSWNWWISNWKNCWHVSESFLFIHFRLRSTLSYSY